MKQIKILRPISITIGTILFITSIVTTFFISNFLLNKKYETQQQASEAKIIEYKLLNSQYQEQINGFFQVQTDIRSYINELVELLYARESYLPIDGIGGIGANLPVNEQTPIFQLKHIISNLNDDQRAMEMIKNYLVARRQFAESFPFIWPVPGGVPRVSSAYGVRANEEVGSVLGTDRPKDGIHFHAGIDIPGDLGDPLQATADGRVVYINENNPVYGKVFVIQHDYGFQTLYGHMTDLNVVTGQYVKRGDIVGYMGNTGASYGVHVHYEIKKDGYHVDPMLLLGMNY